jgi:hypothetical protein
MLISYVKLDHTLYSINYGSDQLHISTGVDLRQEWVRHHLSLTDSQGAEKSGCHLTPVRMCVCEREREGGGMRDRNFEMNLLEVPL